MSPHKDIYREVSQNQQSHKLHCISLSFENYALYLTSYILKIVGVLTSVGPARDNNANLRVYG